MYDAWGQPIGKNGTLAETLGTLNPFRYRGYVFDEETGLYYLRCRYYNPQWGRFVNADNYLSTNVFSYCGNVPSVFVDKNGHERKLYDNLSEPWATKLELVFISETWYNSSMKEVRAGRKPYPTDLTDSQWEEIEPLYSGMRNRKWSKRELTNAVLYIVKTGCQWRQLPHDFPPYQTVYSFFSRGAKSGLWEKILAHLVEKTRKDAGKSAEPHYALIDSQSVKTVADNEARGIDGGKKQKGANGMPS